MRVGGGSLTHSFPACVCFLVTFREAVASQSVIAHVSLALLALFQSRQPARFPRDHDICLPHKWNNTQFHANHNQRSANPAVKHPHRISRELTENPRTRPPNKPRASLHGQILKLAGKLRLETAAFAVGLKHDSK